MIFLLVDDWNQDEEAHKMKKIMFMRWKLLTCSGSGIMIQNYQQIQINMNIDFQS